MRSLFLKIFLSYWLAQALFVVLAVLATVVLRERGEYAAWDAQQATVLSKAVQAYEHGGQPEVRRYLDEVREQLHVRTHLLDEQGQGLSGHDLPPWAKSLGKGITPPRRDLWQWLMPSPFRRQMLTAASGRRYTLVAFLPPRGAYFGPGGVPGLGILIGVVSSGLVCYLLALYLTAPVVRLRAATQRLAAGDLTARAGGLAARRRDEMAQLVRDFDTMAERLEESVNAQARLLHDISHELRSPLARLNVASALARQRAGEEARGALDRIDLEAERLNDLIGGLLAIARLESGSDAERSPILVGEMVEEIAADADFEAQGRNCRVESVIKDDCVVNGAPILLHSAIENVVRNAARYTREGTSVQISLERVQGTEHPEAVIRVADSGPGVPEDALDKLFRPFYRIDDARGRQTGGVGLGLAITERAVRLHGGTVQASNRPEGGLQIEIRLPLAAVGPSRDATRATEPHVDPAETSSSRST
jgi:two-component system, OmpR family, sensor histidine kinase CpxA